MSRLWIGVAIYLLGAAAPIPFEQEGLWGYRDAHGTVVIPARYLVADPFSPEGIAAVADEKEWAIIDRTGKVLVHPFLFDNGPDEFHQRLARCVEDGKFGFFDKHGRIVIPPRFSYADPFSGGRAHVCFDCVKVSDGEHSRYEGKRWGWIDRKGREVKP
jgi:rRNA maturation protein Nop10